MGLDGKTYPRSPLTEQLRLNVIGLCHGMAHDGCSVRTIRGRLADEFGIRRSVGSIHAYLNGYWCAECEPVQVDTNDAPEHTGEVTS